MTLSEYFEKTTGKGVMSTADSSGRLTAAIYARPHFVDEETAAFIMADRLTHKNLESNPHAVYLFMESGRNTREEALPHQNQRRKEQPLLDTLRRRVSCPVDEEYKDRFLVYFKVDKVLPLIGDKKRIMNRRFSREAEGKP